VISIRERYDETIGWIAWNPEAFPKKHGVLRRAILKRSYYIIYFVVEKDRSLVIAVLDGRRDPTEIFVCLFPFWLLDLPPHPCG
jgi:hypothetical protein